MSYTTSEYTDMIIAYGMAGRNARAAARLYAEQFPDRERHPHQGVILRCVQRARKSGVLIANRRTVGGAVQNVVDNEEKVLAAIEENPQNSVRRLAETLGASYFAPKWITSISLPTCPATFAERPGATH